VRENAFHTETYQNLLCQVKVSGTISGKAFFYVRLYSGEDHLFESRAWLTEGKTHSFRVDLSSWKYRRRITRVMLLIQPAGGGWKEGASARFASIGLG
jgi:hypothetical protein